MKKQLFEETIKAKFEGFQAEAPSWDIFQKELAKAESKSYFLRNGLIITGVTVITLSLAYYFLNEQSNPSSLLTNNELNTSIIESKSTLNDFDTDTKEIEVVGMGKNNKVNENVEIHDVNTKKNLITLKSQLTENPIKNRIDFRNNEPIKENELSLKKTEIPAIQSIKNEDLQDFSVFISDTKVCLGETVQVQADKINLNSDYTIEFGDGMISEGFSAAHTYSKPGIYHVVIKAKQGDVEIARKNRIEIIKSPKIEITQFEKDKSQLVNKAIFEANSSSDNYSWYIDNQIVSKESKFDHTFDRAGNYIVKCISTSDKCESSIQRSIQIEGYYNLQEFTPTAFTPDNDGKNDYFELASLKDIQARNVSIKIFDRNGKLHFQSNNLNDKWDGVNQEDGKLAPSQSGYFWVVELINEKNIKEVYRGTFVLVR